VRSSRDDDDGVLLGGAKADAVGAIPLGTVATADAAADFQVLTLAPSSTFSSTSRSGVQAGTYPLRQLTSGETRIRFYDTSAVLLDRYPYDVTTDGSLTLTNLQGEAPFTMAPSPADEPYKVSFSGRPC
jgi:hypothetical protein